MTTSDEPKLNQPPTRGAAEWGLASLLLGGFLAVLAMLTLQYSLQMYLSPRAWPQGDLRPIHDVALVGAIVLVCLTGTSIAFGIRSLAIAYQRAQSCALGWAGTLLSIFALLLWIGTFVDLFSVLDMLMRGAPTNALNVLKQVLPGGGMH